MACSRVNFTLLLLLLLLLLLPLYYYYYYCYYYYGAVAHFGPYTPPCESFGTTKFVRGEDVYHVQLPNLEGQCVCLCPSHLSKSVRQGWRRQQVSCCRCVHYLSVGKTCLRQGGDTVEEAPTCWSRGKMCLYREQIVDRAVRSRSLS